MILRRHTEGLAVTGPDSGAHFRSGIVSDQQMSPPRVRVRFPDRDNVESWWLPVLQRKTQDDKDFDLPDKGEQVACFMDARDEGGVVLGAIYSTVDGPPPGMTPDKHHRTYKDGAVTEYDRSTHCAKMELPAGSSVSVKQEAGSSLGVTQAAGGMIAITQDGAGVLTLNVGSGSTVSVIHGAGASVAIGPDGSLTVLSPTMATVTAPMINAVGSVTVMGTLTVAGETTLTGDVALVGKLGVTGNVRATGSVEQNVSPPP